MASFKKLAEKEISCVELGKALEMLGNYKIAVFVVAYNAEQLIESVIRRIPKQILHMLSEIFVIDDSSTDGTYDVALKIKDENPGINFNVYRTPFNRGYGGNQKLGYLYCIEKGYDFVVLLHGDGQYAPEFIPRVLATFDEKTDAVFASRMINKQSALQGGMPLYKWIGNQFLTKLQNLLMGSYLTEFHTGFRAYRISSLRNVPFVCNSDDFHFDTEIIIQAIASGWKINEVAIPTHYGNEVCHVQSVKYAFNCIRAVAKYHLVNIGLFYERNFDFGLFENENAQFKKSPNSLHQYILRKVRFHNDANSLELGAKRGLLSSHIALEIKNHTAADAVAPDSAGRSRVISVDVNNNVSKYFPGKYFDTCISLDLIEHLDDPEAFLSDVFQIIKPNGTLYISTSNIGYLPVRIMLLLGQFNYGKRGILDKTHKRLFTVGSFKRLLSQYGFKIESVSGFAPPVTDLVSGSRFMCFLESIHTWLSRIFPKLFAYNFLVTARRMDDISEIFSRTIRCD